jgi:hypothetical protein
MDDVAHRFNSLPPPVATGPNIAVPIGGGRGVCASLLSPDDLDRLAVEFAYALVEAHGAGALLYAADLGCSPFFPQSIRLAEAGMLVDCFDVEQPHAELKRINASLGSRLHYYVSDLADSSFECPRAGYSLLYSNRLISHLRFADARRLIGRFTDNCRPGARLFLSMSSVDSDLAEGYPDLHRPVEERFSVPLSARARENQLSLPLCLYSEADVRDRLLTNLPLEVGQLFSSKTGSIKVVIMRS